MEVYDAVPGMIYLVLSGSRLYGTSTANSDIDYRGVFAHLPKEVFGFERRETKTLDGTNDTLLHSLRKFVNLLNNSNPTALEILFSCSDGPLFIHPSFQNIIRSRFLFLSLECIPAFTGTAKGQILKAVTFKTIRDKFRHGTPLNPYDSKYVMHAFRIIYQLRDILNTGDFTPVLKTEDKNFLIDILEGRQFKDATEIHPLYNAVVKEVSSINKIKMQAKIDKEVTEQLMIDAQIDYLKREKLI